ncbi:MAG: T9SS C-terminal target domain-containing protein [Calditrichaeota bacterium]|nr:MAG: T9SS C-terminal target domain-containing protein [Calditrichota bacterium]MBL1206500.1 T9SS C-terminal target domain-containing protein [Calditrichota bacterium]NOG46327.1 T9SS type A sorting domain-containing protein [Calditrichota bacterium]
MNKLIRMFFALIMISGISFAQSYSVHFEDSSISGQPMEELIIEGTITNTLESEIVVFITRENQNLPDNWSSSLCFKSCFAPWVSTISDTIPGGGVLNFSIHFNTTTEPGSGEATLSISLENSAEKNDYKLAASTNPTGLETPDGEITSFKLLGNYPNPFNGETQIQFESNLASNNALFRIFNIIGKEVFADNFAVKTGLQKYHLNLNQADLASGIYFYQIIHPGKGHLKQTLFGKFNLIK